MKTAAMALGRRLPDTEHLSDQDFLAAVAWAASASKELVAAAQRGDIVAFCAALRKHSLRFARRGGGKKTSAGRELEKPALWSRAAFELTPTGEKLLKWWQTFGGGPKRATVRTGPPGGRAKPTAGSDRQLARLLKSPPPGDYVQPLELLVQLEILQRAGGDLPDEVLFPLWRRTLVSAAALSTTAEDLPVDSAEEDQVLLVQGELPWEAGLLFAGVSGADRLARAGAKVLQEELLDRTDTDGTPEAELLPRLSLWMAPLVRSAEWGRTFRAKPWDGEGRDRFRLLVKRVAPFCRLDGRLALGNGVSQEVTALLGSASRLAGLQSRSAPAALLKDVEKIAHKPHPPRGPMGTGRVKKRSSSSYPVTQSDWAQVACLSSDWSLHSDTLIVAHHAQQPMIDLAALGAPLLSGEWELSLTIEGQAVPLKEDWDCGCWYSDEDADYLELTQSPLRGVTIDRSLLLSRQNHFALFADCISAGKNRRIEYRSQLPLVESVKAKASVTSREWALKYASGKARAFPLALPDDLVQSAPGEFYAREDRLELKQTGVGGLYAPVVINWNPKLKRSYAEWRTLTVTQDRVVLKSDAASGHRLRVGAEQLFVYRRVDHSDEPRAVLGHHTDNETIIGKFDKDGEVDPILMVE